MAKVRFVVAGEPKEPEEIVVGFKLVQGPADGCVNLYAIDASGNLHGPILGLFPCEPVRRYTTCQGIDGLLTDAAGRVCVR